LDASSDSDSSFAHSVPSKVVHSARRRIFIRRQQLPQVCSKGVASVYLLYWYKSTNTDTFTTHLQQLLATAAAGV
jgi:hypothetical protein